MTDEQEQREDADQYLTNPFGLLTTSGDLDVVQDETDDESEEKE